MDAFDDVAALAQFSQCRLGALVHHPLAGTDLVSETEGFELAHAPNFQCVKLVRLAAGPRCEIDDAVIVAAPLDMPVETGPAFAGDLPFERVVNVPVGPIPKLLRDQVLNTGAHPVLDIIAGDDEVFAVIGTASRDHMDMRVLCVPVIDSNPVEFCAEILFRLAHQVAGEGFEVCHFHRIFRRDDEAKMVAIVFAAFSKLVRVDFVDLRTEQARLFSISSNAFATQIGKMRGERRAAAVVPDHARLDNGDARTAGKPAVGLHAGTLAASEV